MFSTLYAKRKHIMFRILRTDLGGDNKKTLFFVILEFLAKIPHDRGCWVLQISGIFLTFPILQLLYQFDQSKHTLRPLARA
jgi:hypothetical protein